MKLRYVLILLCWLYSSLLAEVPQLINYAGRISVNNVNYDGTGNFKFALLTENALNPVQATATGTVASGFLIGISVANSGSGYLEPPPVIITDASGSGATAVANISEGAVSSITVLNAGSGYSNNPTISIGPPSSDPTFDTNWSNDGSSVEGSEPVSSAPISVVKGFYSVFLGDTVLPNMLPIPSSVFDNSNVFLRVWFSDGVNGFQQLNPDKRIVSNPYAMRAQTANNYIGRGSLIFSTP